MSSDYSLRCSKCDVYAGGAEVATENGSSGFLAVRWAAAAGPLVEAAMKFDGGDMASVTCWSRGVDRFLSFSAEHAACGGLTVMRDQGGGPEADEKVVPGRPCGCPICGADHKPGGY